MTNILITGLCGFVGHHIAEEILKNTDWHIVGLDRLSHSGTLHRLTSMDRWDEWQHRVTSVHHDLRSPLNEHVVKRIGNVEMVLHLAASSHVDRSIANPMDFVLDNVVGTCNLLDYCRVVRPNKIIYFSTDEVFGPAEPSYRYREWDRYKSGNPYAATKAGAEELAVAYQNTYGLPIAVTHTMNVFGERQHPEKFIPSTIRKVLAGETVTIHANKDKTQAGVRSYIHARNVAAALIFIFDEFGFTEIDKFNIVGEEEADNLALALFIAFVIGKPLNYEMVDFHSSRPGHDLRYALDGRKMDHLGFVMPKSFTDSLRKTIQWTLKNPEWL